MPIFFDPEKPYAASEVEPNTSPEEHKQKREVQNEDDFDEDPLKTYLSWIGPSRPYRKKDRSFYTTTAIIAVLLVLILFLAQEYLAIGAVMAFCFLVYVLNFIPPHEVDYRISNQGIMIEDRFYVWDELDAFWFSEKEGQKIINIQTWLRFPSVLLLPVADQSEESLRKTLAKHLDFLEVAPRSFMDNWSEKLQKHFPLENPHR